MFSVIFIMYTYKNIFKINYLYTMLLENDKNEFQINCIKYRFAFCLRNSINFNIKFKIFYFALSI